MDNLKNTVPENAEALEPDNSTLEEAVEDFMLSRRAIPCRPNTLRWYKFTLKWFFKFLHEQGVHTPGEINVRLIREYIVGLIERGLRDTTVHSHARAIRTFLIFLYEEKYLPERLSFIMPKIEKRRKPVLSAQQIEHLVEVGDKRDKAIILTMADTGLRREEVCLLNWNDLDFATGLLQVKRGKGGKARVGVVGAVARRALMSYRRTLKNKLQDSPMFQTKSGNRFTAHGFRMLCERLSEKAGFHFSPHMLRRSFTILSLRSGMPVLHLQALLGHSTLFMVNEYAQLVTEDLLEAHNAHSPVDNLKNLK